MKGRYAFTPEGASPLQDYARPKPLRRSKSRSETPTECINVHVGCMEQIRSLSEEIERMKAEHASNLEECEAAIISLRDDLSNKTTQLQQSEDAKMNLIKRVERQNEKMKIILETTELEMGRLHTTIAEQDDDLRHFKGERVILNGHLNTIQSACDNVLPQQEEDRLPLKSGIINVAELAVFSVENVCNFTMELRDSLSATEQALASTESEGNAQVEQFSATISSLKSQVDYLENILSRTSASKDSEIDRLKSAYKKLLDSKNSPAPYSPDRSRSKSPEASPRNPNPWIPTGGGYPYQAGQPLSR